MSEERRRRFALKGDRLSESEWSVAARWVLRVRKAELGVVPFEPTVGAPSVRWTINGQFLDASGGDSERLERRISKVLACDDVTIGDVDRSGVFSPESRLLGVCSTSSPNGLRQFLDDHPGLDINLDSWMAKHGQPNEDWWRPIHLAAANPALGADDLAFLFQRGARFDEAGKHGKTPMLCTLAKPPEDGLIPFLEAGADPRSMVEYGPRPTPAIELLIYKGDDYVAPVFDSGFTLHSLSGKNLSRVMSSAIDCGSVAIFRAAIEQGVDLAAPRFKGGKRISWANRALKSENPDLRDFVQSWMDSNTMLDVEPSLAESNQSHDLSP